MSDPQDVGSLAEEAVKLTEALLGDTGFDGTGFDGTGSDGTGSDGTGYREHQAACAWCPACRLVSALGDHPEVIEQFAGGLAMLLQAGRAFGESAGQATAPRTGPR